MFKIYIYLGVRVCVCVDVKNTALNESEVLLENIVVVKTLLLQTKINCNGKFKLN